MRSVHPQGNLLVVMTGMETHVCVMQAALGLRSEGLDVFIVDDAVGSRPAAQRLAIRIGFELDEHAGVDEPGDDAPA